MSVKINEEKTHYFISKNLKQASGVYNKRRVHDAKFKINTVVV